jgi:hypothetical protein
MARGPRTANNERRAPGRLPVVVSVLGPATAPGGCEEVVVGFLDETPGGSE